MTSASSWRAARRVASASTCCLGVRLERDGHWRVYAPHGLADVFNLVVRPNPVLAPREVYETKTARWRQQWPELTVLDWPSAPNHPDACLNMMRGVAADR